MKALVTILIMGLVFTSPALFAKGKHAKPTKVKHEKTIKKEKKAVKETKEEEPAPQDDGMDDSEQSMDEGAGE